MWNNKLTLAEKIHLARDILHDEDPIIGSSVPWEMLEEYCDVECLRCYYCNQSKHGNTEKGVLEHAPYMAWSHDYLYIFKNGTADDQDLLIFATNWYSGAPEIYYDKLPVLDGKQKKFLSMRHDLPHYTKNHYEFYVHSNADMGLGITHYKGKIDAERKK